MVKQYRIGFKGKNQLPLFMVWVEYWPSMDDNDPYYAEVLFCSSDFSFRDFILDKFGL